MNKTITTLISLLIVCLLLALTLNVLFITGVISGSAGVNGANGKDGADGKSAFEIFQEHNPEWKNKTEAEWLEWLKGTNGNDGEDGKDGQTPQWFSGNSLTEVDGAVDGDFFWLTYNGSQFVTGFSVYRMVDGKWTLFADMTTKIDQSQATPPTDGYHIGTVEELKAFRDSVNATSGSMTYQGKTIYLDADIDLANENWTPIGIGPEKKDDPNQRPFEGIFDGQNHTISNLTVNTPTKNYVGLFGFSTDKAEIKNFTLKNVNLQGNHYVASVVGNAYTTRIIENVNVVSAVIKGTHWVAGIVGSIYGNVNNCNVSNFEIVCSVENLGSSYDNGDKVGGIVGQLQDSSGYQVTNCTVDTGTISAYRDLGGIVGCAADSRPYKVTGNTLKDVKLIIDRSITYGSGTQDKNVGYFVGRQNTSNGADFTTGNTQVGCEIKNGD